jgi:hypothetical protein
MQIKPELLDAIFFTANLHLFLTTSSFWRNYFYTIEKQPFGYGKLIKGIASFPNEAFTNSYSQGMRMCGFTFLFVALFVQSGTKERFLKEFQKK